jgi:hypothetical protein
MAPRSPLFVDLVELFVFFFIWFALWNLFDHYLDDVKATAPHKYVQLNTCMLVFGLVALFVYHYYGRA